MVSEFRIKRDYKRVIDSARILTEEEKKEKRHLDDKIAAEKAIEELNKAGTAKRCRNAAKSTAKHGCSIKTK